MTENPYEEEVLHLAEEIVDDNVEIISGTAENKTEGHGEGIRIVEQTIEVRGFVCDKPIEFEIAITGQR